MLIKFKFNFVKTKNFGYYLIAFFEVRRKHSIKKNTESIDYQLYSTHITFNYC